MKSNKLIIIFEEDFYEVQYIRKYEKDFYCRASWSSMLQYRRTFGLFSWLSSILSLESVSTMKGLITAPSHFFVIFTVSIMRRDPE